MPIDRRAWPGTLVLGAFLALSWFLAGLQWLTVLAFALLIFHAAFFRVPPFRKGSSVECVSPASGKIVEITSVFEDKFLKGKALKIGIFLSLFDAHITYAPMAGEISFLDYVPGQFFNALDDRSLAYNESNWIGIAGTQRSLLIRQVAGTIARRIACDVELKDSISEGSVLGIICYGSRVEIFIPEKCFQSQVTVGTKLIAGKTILGQWLS